MTRTTSCNSASTAHRTKGAKHPPIQRDRSTADLIQNNALLHCQCPLCNHTLTSTDLSGRFCLPPKEPTFLSADLIDSCNRETQAYASSIRSDPSRGSIVIKSIPKCSMNFKRTANVLLYNLTRLRDPKAEDVTPTDDHPFYLDDGLMDTYLGLLRLEQVALTIHNPTRKGSWFCSTTYLGCHMSGSEEMRKPLSDMKKTLFPKHVCEKVGAIFKEYDLMFFPTCDQLHWSLLIVDLSCFRFIHLNSLKATATRGLRYVTKTFKHILPLIVNFLREEWMEWRGSLSDGPPVLDNWKLERNTFRGSPCTIQPNGYDCGVLVLWNISSISRGNPIQLSHLRLDQARQLIRTSITKKQALL